MVKALPNTSFLPVPKSAPAGHATAAAHLLWQVFPRYPCLEYKDNSGQSCPVRYTWTASFGPGLMFWQKRFNLTPQFVAYQFPGHLLHPHWYFTAYSSICQVLLGALKQAVVWPSATVRSPRGHGVCGRRWTMSQPGRCCCHRPCSQPCDGMAKCHLTQLPPACANLPPAALSQIHGRNKSFHPCLVGCRDSRRPF